MLDRAARGGDLHALVERFFTTFATDNELISEAIRRMLAAGGKRLRPRFTLLAAACAGAEPEAHLALAAYMELIHVATLIHDDVVDGATTRRGVNATAVDFGNRVSVLAGDYLFAWIFKNVTANYAPPIPHVLSATLADITDGEVLQLRALGKTQTRLGDWVEIARKKTASLFAAATECGALDAGAAALEVKALRDFGLYYGIAFQMMDDLLDMTADAATVGKPVGNDLRERKMTAPLILALEGESRDLRSEVERSLESGEELAPERIAALIAAIGRHGGFDRTRAEIARYVERAKQSLVVLPPTPARAELAALADALAGTT